MNTSHKYQNHKIGCSRSEIDKIFNSDQNTSDRNYMRAQIECHLNYLSQHGISQLGSISKLLHSYGFKADDERRLLSSFEAHKSLQNPTNQIIFMKQRELKKANSGERNVVFNRVVHEYSAEFLQFFIKYVHDNHPCMVDKNKLIQDMSQQANQLLAITCTQMGQMQNENIQTDSSPDENKKNDDQVILFDGAPMWPELDLSDDFISNSYGFESNDSFFDNFSF